MTYAAHLDELARTPVTYVVMTLDACSLTFGVSPCTATGAACYNTFFTCKDQANYAKTSKDYTFCTADAPLPWPGPRPYIVEAGYLPTEIKDAITVGARAKITLQDEPDTDVGIDPYVTTRTPPVLGAYFKKLLARNPNYEGRSIVIYDGFYGDAVGEFQVRFKGKIDLMDFTGQGRFVIEAVDLLQALDRIDVPPKLSIKSVANITAAQTTVTLSSVTGLDAAGFVRIDDEILYYGAISGNQLTGITRAQFATVAATHNANVKVQKCAYWAPQSPFALLLNLVESQGGYTSADVDEPAFNYWEMTPAADPNVSAIVSEPMRLSDLIKEVCQLFDLRIWQSETQKITVTRPLPNNPDTTYSELADASNIVLNSPSVRMNPKNYPVVVSGSSRSGSQQVNASRISRLVLRWDKDAVGDMDDDASFNRIDIAINATSEGANAYNSVAEAEIRTRWLRTAGWSTEEQRAEALASLTAHYIFLRGDPQPLLTLETELKDADILVGTFARVSTDEIVNADGSGVDQAKFIVVRRDPGISKIRLTLLRLPATRLAYIADDGAADYDSATEAEREYAYVTDDNGLINDQPGYYIW